MASASTLQDAVAEKLQQYMSIKRREEDFDCSGKRKRTSGIVYIRKPKPMINYSQLKDRSLKHYFTSQMIRTQIAQLEAMPSGTQREKDIKKSVTKKMEQRSSEDPALDEPDYYDDAHKARLKALKYLKRDTSRRLFHRINYGSRLSRKVLSPNLSKGEANRIVDHASQILVATETVALAQEILDEQYNKDRRKRPQSAPVHLPSTRDDPSGSKKSSRRRNTRPKYCWDINGRRVPYNEYMKSQRRFTSDYSTTTFDDSEYEYILADRRSRPTSAMETRRSRTYSTRNSLRNRPYSADVLYLGYNEAKPSESRRGFAFHDNVYAIDMATQTVQDIGLQTDMALLTPKPPSDIRKYYLKVTTGDKSGAGTIADVYVILQGNKRKSDEIFLTKPLSGKRAFKRGRIDDFIIETENVGQIQSLGIGHDQQEKDFSWFVESIEIKSGSEFWTFSCEKWLSGYIGSKKSFRFFKPTESSHVSRRRHRKEKHRPRSSTKYSDDSSQSSRSSGPSRSRTSLRRQRNVKSVEKRDSSSSSHSRSTERARITKDKKPVWRPKSSSHSPKRSSHSESDYPKKSNNDRKEEEQMETDVNSHVMAMGFVVDTKSRDDSEVEYSTDGSSKSSIRQARSTVEESDDSSDSSSSSSTIKAESDHNSHESKQKKFRDSINSIHGPIASGSSFSEPDPNSQRRRGSLFEKLKESSSDMSGMKEKNQAKSPFSSSKSDSSDDEDFFNQDTKRSPIQLETAIKSKPTTDKNEKNDTFGPQIKDGSNSSSSDSEDSQKKQIPAKVPVIALSKYYLDSPVSNTEVKEEDEKPKVDVRNSSMYSTLRFDGRSSSPSSSSSEDEKQDKESRDRIPFTASITQEFPTSLSTAFPMSGEPVKNTNVIDDKELENTLAKEVSPLYEPEVKPPIPKVIAIESSESDNAVLLSSSSSEDEKSVHPVIKLTEPVLIPKPPVSSHPETSQPIKESSSGSSSSTSSDDDADFAPSNAVLGSTIIPEPSAPSKILSTKEEITVKESDLINTSPSFSNERNNDVRFPIVQPSMEIPAYKSELNVNDSKSQDSGTEDSEEDSTSSNSSTSSSEEEEEEETVKPDVAVHEETLLIDATNMKVSGTDAIEDQSKQTEPNKKLPLLDTATINSESSEESDAETVSSGDYGELLSSSSSSDEGDSAIVHFSGEKLATIQPANEISPPSTVPSIQAPVNQDLKNIPETGVVVARVPVTADVHRKAYESSSSSSTDSSSEEDDYILDPNDIYNAIRDDNIERVREIVSKHPEVINSPANSDMTPLQYAAANGMHRSIKFLLESKADYSIETRTGYTAMHLAAKHGHVHAVEVMISFGINLESQNVEGLTPLHVAAISGQLDIVKCLTFKGADIQSKDMTGRSVIALARQNHHENIVNFLTNYMRKQNITMESSSSRSSSASSSSSSSSSSSDSEEEEKQRPSRHSVSDALAQREQEELEEKKRIYDQQQNAMQKRRISFLDEIRMENE